MEFTKAHGTANDFVVVVDLEDQIELSAVLVRALADRRRGVGADGVIRITAGVPGADVGMDYRNADGSVVETCGNGLRVVAKHVVDHGLVRPTDDGGLTIATRAGVAPVEVRRGADGRVAQVTVEMGVPVLDPAELPFETDEPDAPTHRIEVDGGSVEVAVVSMGNPHAVTVVDDVSSAPVAVLGPRVETHPRFPAKANVGFAEVVDAATVRLRVWERGVGETAACGSGACAAVVALQRLGQVGDEVDVQLPGGTLAVRYTAGGSVIMTGPAVEVYHGVLDEAWIEAARNGEVTP